MGDALSFSSPQRENTSAEENDRLRFLSPSKWSPYTGSGVTLLGYLPESDADHGVNDFP